MDWTAWGVRYPDPARAGYRAAILDLVADHEGPESAGIAAHWFDRQRDGFVVIREPDGSLRGFLGLVDLGVPNVSLPTEQVFKWADELMYGVKKSGKGRCLFASRSAAVASSAATAAASTPAKGAA